ncbi:uncharacterized protein LOC109830562 [Asparagus officinalis]|uniref:uncharacterized protein LOC109830562 n=1 Tax=Asparagus officinalis TaxID=4686 RepID=UPI00098E1C68|nr:uncharacterized protein LOC109830562 [Asparagus officinalis]
MNSAAASYDEEAILLKLQNAQSNLLAVLAESSELNRNLAAGDKRLSFGLETVAAASDAVAPLQTQHIAAKALRSRINRAVSPALLVLDNFALVESLQRRLLSLSDDTSTRYVYKSGKLYDSYCLLDNCASKEKRSIELMH